MFSLEDLPAQWRDFHLVMHIIRYLEESHLEHLEHVCLPIAHAHILAHTKGLQLIIVISRNGRRLHASQYLDTGTHGNLFARTDHGTQRLLGKHGTIEGAGRIVANITMTTILTGGLSEIIQEDSSSADSRFGVFFHSSQFSRFTDFCPLSSQKERRVMISAIE